MNKVKQPSNTVLNQLVTVYDKHTIKKLITFLEWERENTKIENINGTTHIILLTKYLPNSLPMTLNFTQYRNYKESNELKKLERLSNERKDLMNLFPSLQKVWSYPTVHYQLPPTDLVVTKVSRKYQKKMKQLKKSFYYYLYSCKKNKHTAALLQYEKKQCRLLENSETYIVNRSYYELENVIEHFFEFTITNYPDIENGVYIVVKILNENKSYEKKILNKKYFKEESSIASKKKKLIENYLLFKKVSVNKNDDTNIHILFSELYKYRDNHHLPRSFEYIPIVMDSQKITDLLSFYSENFSHYLILSEEHSNLIFSERKNQPNQQIALSDQITVEYYKNQTLILTLSAVQIETIENELFLKYEKSKNDISYKTINTFSLFSIKDHYNHIPNLSYMLRNDNPEVFSSIHLQDLLFYSIENKKRFFLRDLYYCHNSNSSFFPDLYNKLSVFIEKSDEITVLPNSYRKKIVFTFIFPNYFSITLFLELVTTSETFDDFVFINKIKSFMTKLLVTCGLRNGPKSDRDEMFVDIHFIKPKIKLDNKINEVIEMYVDFQKMSLVAQYVLKIALSVVQTSPISLYLTISFIDFQHSHKKTKDERYKNTIPAFTLELQNFPSISRISSTNLPLPKNVILPELHKSVYDKLLIEEVALCMKK